MRKFEGFEHGINLGGWLSQCSHDAQHCETFISENDIKRISDWNLDHVRLPVDYELVMADDGSLIRSGFEIIDRAYAWCRKYGLNMVLDLHKTYGFSFDVGENETGFFENADYQERFFILWEAFAERYGRYYEHMAFELLNEVTDREYSDAWNGIICRCISGIRKKASKTYIIIGGYHNNSIEALPDLAEPVDSRVVYTFHCYEPLIFTHQGAYWAPGMDVNFRMSLKASYKEMEDLSKKYLSQVTIGFEGFDGRSTLGTDFFEKYFAEAVAVAEKRNVPLYCGEYGVINLAGAEDTLGWYEMIAEAFDMFRIGRAAWTYKEMDFGIMDHHMDDIREAVVRRL